jgi:hypothetical protein
MAILPCRVAIIGTRTPDKYQAEAAKDGARCVSEIGCTVTTGAAFGIDTEAMTGATPGHLEVYLPWANYNSGLVPKHAKVTVYNPKIHIDWTASVKRYHPAPYVLTRGALALHARNFGIVNKAVAVVAFPDEKGEGGTAQGIRIARGLNIHVIECRKGASTSHTLFREIISALHDVLPHTGPTPHGQNELLPCLRSVSPRPPV